MEKKKGRKSRLLVFKQGDAKVLIMSKYMNKKYGMVNALRRHLGLAPDPNAHF